MKKAPPRTALNRWRDRIMTALQQRGRLRRATLLDACQPHDNWRDVAQIDIVLKYLVENGRIVKPTHGLYALPTQTESPTADV